jgi:hypothetical protein
MLVVVGVLQSAPVEPRVTEPVLVLVVVLTNVPFR